jgi:transposase
MSTYQQRRAEWEERRAREQSDAQRKAAQREADAQRKREQRLAELAALYAGDAVDDISPSPSPAQRKGGEYDAHGNFVEGRLTHAQKRERRDKALKMLRETNMTQAQVAAAFHVSRTSVYHWACAANIPPRNKADSWSPAMCQRQSAMIKGLKAPDPQRVALAVQMYNDGARVEQIMSAVNIARSTVYEWAHKYGGNPQARAKAMNK